MNRNEEVVRGTAELFRDEFRAMSCRYLPIYHERFLSVLPVTSEGWQAFAEAHRSSTDEWEKWYFAKELGWLGHFYGCGDAWNDFAHAVERLRMRPIFVDTWSDEKDDSMWQWMDIIHDLAESYQTPLLHVKGSIWNQEPHAGLEKVEEILGIMPTPILFDDWDSRSSGNARFPENPLRRELRTNVFSASVIALEIFLAPKRFIWGNFNPSDLPFHPCPTAEDEVAASPKQTTVALQSTQLPSDLSARFLLNEDSDATSDFVFHRSDDYWFIRYKFGKTVRTITPQNSDGLEYLSAFLSHPGQSMSCLALSPPKPGDDDEANVGTKPLSSLTEREAMEQLTNVDGQRQFTSERPWERSIRFCEAIRKAEQDRKSLESRLMYETDPKHIVEIQEELEGCQRILDKKEYLLGATGQAEKAFKRVKQAYGNALRRLVTSGHKELADHLRVHIKPDGFSYRYQASPSIPWQL